MAARGARAAGREAADHRVLGRRHAVRLEPVGSRLCAATTRTRLPGLRIEIGVAAAGIDGAVPDADIRETGGVIGSDRYVSGDVRHPVVNAVVPAQRRLRDQIPEAPHRIAETIGARAIVWAARAAGSHPHLASVLLQGPKNANIHASSGVIRGIPAQIMEWTYVTLRLEHDADAA